MNYVELFWSQNFFVLWQLVFKVVSISISSIHGLILLLLCYLDLFVTSSSGHFYCKSHEPNPGVNIAFHTKPVDFATRGLFPSEIISHPLRWTSPSFLLEPSKHWPKLHKCKTDALTKRSTVLLVNMTSDIMNLLCSHSSVKKILRITAYCIRWSKSMVENLQAFILIK